MRQPQPVLPKTPDGVKDAIERQLHRLRVDYVSVERRREIAQRIGQLVDRIVT